jgi:hypothetical protein
VSTYTIHYRDGTTERIEADWIEQRDGVTYFMRQRKTLSTAPGRSRRVTAEERWSRSFHWT